MTFLTVNLTLTLKSEFAVRLKLPSWTCTCSGDTTRPHWFPCGNCVSLAEVGSLSLEFEYLSAITGDKTYAALTRRVNDLVLRQPRVNGLVPNFLDLDNGAPACEWICILIQRTAWVSTAVGAIRDGPWWCQGLYHFNNHLWS